MGRIAICSEIFSPNLGDGVIADCLMWLLKQADPDASFTLVDLSGRAGFAVEKEVRTPGGWMHAVHQTLSRAQLYRKAAAMPTWFCCQRKKINRRWRDKLGDCDLVLIGGGQLLMDNELRFPLRIHEMVRLCNRTGKNVGCYACGVGDNWSRLGLYFLKGALTDQKMLWVSVRDKRSCHTLKSLLAENEFECVLSVDPAVFASQAYQIKRNPESNLIGLNISAPKVFIRQSTACSNPFSNRKLKRFWLELIHLLMGGDRQVVLFTNGAPDDHDFAADIISTCSLKSGSKRPYLLEKAHKPRELVAQVSQLQAVIAHRLHANIIAYSLGIPSVGLTWDRKVAEFGKSTGRSKYYLSPECQNPVMVRRCLDQAVNDGIAQWNSAASRSAAVRQLQNMLQTAQKTSWPQLHQDNDG